MNNFPIITESPEIHTFDDIVFPQPIIDLLLQRIFKAVHEWRAKNNCLPIIMVNPHILEMMFDRFEQKKQYIMETSQKRKQIFGCLAEPHPYMKIFSFGLRRLEDIDIQKDERRCELAQALIKNLWN